MTSSSWLTPGWMQPRCLRCGTSSSSRSPPVAPRTPRCSRPRNRRRTSITHANGRASPLWAITEYYGKLKASFSYLKAYEEAGTAEEIANARANVVYLMGIMGHYVADCAQPLHTTKHHNGWVGLNPNGYTTWAGIHSWIDGGLAAKAGLAVDGFARKLAPKLSPRLPLSVAARADGRDPVFVAVMDYLLAQNQLVEPLYQMEKQGQLSNEQEKNDRGRRSPGPVDAAGRALIERQLLKGGEMLSAIWVTAWKEAPPEVYLRAQLLRRQTTAAKTTP